MNLVKLENNVDYEKAVADHGNLSEEIRAKKIELDKLKIKLDEVGRTLNITLASESPNFATIDKQKQGYLVARRKLEILQDRAKNYPAELKKIASTVKPEVMKIGASLNREILSSLEVLGKLRGEYVELRDIWAKYDRLESPSFAVKDYTNVVGPQPGRGIVECVGDEIIEHFKKNSANYQKSADEIINVQVDKPVKDSNG